jgi:uncharacterized protein YukE
MEVERVEAAARSLQARASEIDGLVGRIDAIVSRVPGVWEGPEAQRFVREWWPTQRRALVAASSRVAGLGLAALKNANEQRDASNTSGASPGKRPTDGPKKLGIGSRERPLAEHTRDLVDEFKHFEGDELVRISEVVGPDGEHRYVVLISGTHGDIDDISVKNYFQTHGWFNNLPASFNLPTTSSGLVELAIQERLKADGRENAEVMLVGYSQGGMIAQTVADRHHSNITEVLTFGSPPVPAAHGYGGANVTRLEHSGDEVINGTEIARGYVLPPVRNAALHLLSMDNPSNADITTFSGGTPGFFAHDIKKTDYDWLSDRYDESSDPEIVRARERQDRFLNGRALE